MKYQINVPEYLTIGDYQKISTIEHLEGAEKAMELIHIISGLDKDVISKWSPEEVSNLVVNVLSTMEIDDTQFYPIVEFEGILYGHRQLSKMRFGEYVDLERLSKDPVSNLAEIAAILYRPISRNELGGIKYGIKQGFKIAKGEAENLFKYYDVEDYDNNKRKVRADLMKNFPASFILGGLSFFLDIGTKSLLSTSNSSLHEEMKKEMMKNEKSLIMTFGAGLAQLIHYQKVPSLASQTRVTSLT